MRECKICGSYAINPHKYDRDDTDLDLCDAHYWQKRAEAEKFIVPEGFHLIASEALDEAIACWAENDRLRALIGKIQELTKAHGV